jgi:hypothetical protein
MEMSKVIDVSKTTELPYIHIPFRSVEAAREKLQLWKNSGRNVDPEATLYRYTGKPEGWQIVAYPIVLVKPEEGEDEQA